MEFHFRFRHLVSFPVKHQLWSGCHSEKSSKKYRKAEYVKRHVCVLSIYSRLSMKMSSLHENVVFSVCAHMGNAAYIIFIMWNSIAGLDTWYLFCFNISCGVAVKVRSHLEKFQVIFYGEGRGAEFFF